MATAGTMTMRPRTFLWSVYRPVELPGRTFSCIGAICKGNAVCSRQFVASLRLLQALKSFAIGPIKSMHVQVGYSNNLTRHLDAGMRRSFISGAVGRE
jgi:hypothetical protein